MYLILFSYFFCPHMHGMRDPTSLSRDQTRAPEVEAWSPNHWTAREIPNLLLLLIWKALELWGKRVT